MKKLLTSFLTVFFFNGLLVHSSGTDFIVKFIQFRKQVQKSYNLKNFLIQTRK